MAQHSLATQFVRFAGVGGIATALMYVLLAIGVEGLGWTAVVSSAAAYCISSVFNYWANYHFTFSSQARHASALPRFAAVAACGLAINAAIMWLLTEWIHWHYLVAQVLATGAVLLWNFFANRHWTYTARPPQS